MALLFGVSLSAPLLSLWLCRAPDRIAALALVSPQPLWPAQGRQTREHEDDSGERTKHDSAPHSHPDAADLFRAARRNIKQIESTEMIYIKRE